MNILVGGEGGMPRRLRTAYTNTQLLELEKEFHFNKYLCRLDPRVIKENLKEGESSTWYPTI